jgi:hypothetical protein
VSTRFVAVTVKIIPPLLDIADGDTDIKATSRTYEKMMEFEIGEKFWPSYESCKDTPEYS